MAASVALSACPTMGRRWRAGRGAPRGAAVRPPWHTVSATGYTHRMSDDFEALTPPAADVRRIAYGADRWQFGDLRLPAGPGPHPVVITIHGGFWRARYDLDYLRYVAAALSAAGLATWNIEYRRIGNAGGGWPDTFLDVAAAADHVRALATTYPLELGRVVALGHSAGGHLAHWLAGPDRVAPRRPLAAHQPLSPAWAVGLARGGPSTPHL